MKTTTRARRRAVSPDDLVSAGVQLTVGQLDALVDTLDGPGEVEDFLNQMTKRVLERVLNEELTAHLGHEPGEDLVAGATNMRNGSTPKMVQTSQGAFAIEVPRDRDASFTPIIVPKGVRRIGRTQDMILSLYARGMSTRDITAHLEEVYGVQVSAATISAITDIVVDEVNAWQNRPLESVYPIVFIDAIHLKIRDGGTVMNKACHVAVGVDVDGRKHVLGMWIAEKEGAKFWANVLAQLKNRGVDDILILCCDGLTGLPTAIQTVYPLTTVQTCVVHLLRTAMKYASYKDRKKMASEMRPIYTAVSADAAAVALDVFAESWGVKAPGAIQAWRNAWEEFTPFLAYPAEIRKVIYTTNQIESINYQLRKITKTRGSFPNDESAMKLLYLSIRNISTTRNGTLGTGTPGWTRALNAFALHYEGRLTP